MESILAVGIDPGKWTNYGVAMIYPEKILLSRSFPNTWTGVLEFDKEVEKIAEQRGLVIIYGVEGGKNCALPLCQILHQRKKRYLLEVNPLKSNRQKDFYGEDKSDAVDARAVAAIVLRSTENLPVIEGGTSLFNDIREAERYLTDLSRRKTQLINKLHSHLSQVYMAHYKDFFPQLKSKKALRFFEQYPIPQYLKGESKEQLMQFLTETGRRYGPFSKEEVQKQIKEKAKTMMYIGTTLGCFPLDRALRIKATIITQLCQQILSLQEDIARIEKLLEKDLLPQTGLHLTSFSGMSTTLAAIIIGESQDTHRFRSSSSYAKYNGTAPAEKASGGRCRHKARKACNKRLKRAFYLLALSSARCDFLSKEYVNRCQIRGISKKEGIKRLARRLSDVIYAMMRDKTTYDRSKVLAGKRKKEKRRGGNLIRRHVATVL